MVRSLLLSDGPAEAGHYVRQGLQRKAGERW